MYESLFYVYIIKHHLWKLILITIDSCSAITVGLEFEFIAKEDRLSCLSRHRFQPGLFCDLILVQKEAARDNVV